MRRLTMMLLLVLATTPVAARTSCDTYGRCFDFLGADDRLDGGDAERLWQAHGAAAPAGDAVAAADLPADLPADPLALAHGTAGEPLQAFADDD